VSIDISFVEYAFMCRSMYDLYGFCIFVFDWSWILYGLL